MNPLMGSCAAAVMTKDHRMAKIPFTVDFRVVGNMQTQMRLADAPLHGDRGSAEAYARRIGVETVDAFDDGLDQALALLRHGLASHVEATATCIRCPLVRAGVPQAGLMHTVKRDVVSAFELVRAHGLEFRTPPSTWTSAPPLQLFEPMPPPRIAAVLHRG